MKDNNWLPMSEVPRDGRKVLVCSEHRGIEALRLPKGGTCYPQHYLGWLPLDGCPPIPRKPVESEACEVELPESTVVELIRYYYHRDVPVDIHNRCPTIHQKVSCCGDGRKSIILRWRK